HSHLVDLYSQGFPLDPMSFVSDWEIEQVREARKELKDPKQLKVYFDHFEGQVPYERIRWALAVIDEEEKAR
ncbi:MAG TPA: hypothetical protein DCP28_32260, partial [Cytophagales bacterium]|nr:hypothetical protein [Cytophagales bacterium]